MDTPGSLGLCRWTFMVLVWAGRQLVLAHSLATFSTRDALTELGPLEFSSEVPRTTAHLPVPRGLKTFAFGLLPSPKCWPRVHLFVSTAQCLQTDTWTLWRFQRNSCWDWVNKGIYIDLDWLGPIHRRFLISSPFFELTWNCLRNAANLLFFLCPNKPCTSWLFIQTIVRFFYLCSHLGWDLRHLYLVKASQKFFCCCWFCFFNSISSFICFAARPLKHLCGHNWRTGGVNCAAGGVVKGVSIWSSGNCASPGTWGQTVQNNAEVSVCMFEPLKCISKISMLLVLK